MLSSEVSLIGSLRNLRALGVSAVRISQSIHRGATEIAEADAEKLKSGHYASLGSFYFDSRTADKVLYELMT